MDTNNILPCPLTQEEAENLPAKVLTAIQDQNEQIAYFQALEHDNKMRAEAAGHSNEDAYAFLWKSRRDALLEILGQRDKYSWRKRDIARRELRLMGYDFLD